MNPALFHLVSRSLWNALVFRVKRLRKPKYLVGAVFGALYVYTYFYRFLLSGWRGPHHGSNVDPFPLAAVAPEAAAFVLMLATLAFAWIVPGSRVLIHFTEAEISWLFPAPFSRSTLVAYKLVKSQIGTLFTAVLFAVISGRFVLGAGIWLRVLGWWIVVTTYQMHRVGASFALQRFRERGLANARRRLALLLGFAAVGAALCIWARETRALPFPAKDPTPAAIFAYLGQLLETGPMVWLLSPFRLIVSPLFAPDPWSFLRSLWPAALVLAANFLWVLRADGSFEEASIALAKTRAAFVAARARGERGFRPASIKVRKPLFPLKSAGSALVGFLWKSSLQAGGSRSFRNGFVAVAAMLVGASILTVSGLWPYARFFLSFLCIGGLLFALLVPSNYAVTQFRRGTEMMDLIKTYPVAGWHVVGGELLGPALWGIGLQCAIAAAFVILTSRPSPDFPPFHLPILPIAAGIAVLPGLNLVTMIVPCAAVLLLPAWFKTARFGIEATGIRLLLLLGQLLAFAFTLLPAAAAAAAVWFLARTQWGIPGTVAAAAPVAGALLLAEGVAGIVLLGRLFDRFDISEEEA